MSSPVLYEYVTATWKVEEKFFEICEGIGRISMKILLRCITRDFSVL